MSNFDETNQNGYHHQNEDMTAVRSAKKKKAILVFVIALLVIGLAVIVAIFLPRSKAEDPAAVEMPVSATVYE